ncbi:hypothetical protein GCM10012289_66540 [Nonomuraea cavernae]|uniref:Uncharacterized protein n=1 Tax=Nonomuraea cavernae TaxID=2045107 RepID=A0A917ZCF6_9ACTN|nr:hypothetical protein GCM10012289_66540 [Nonomuraea cavernae]
MSLTGDMTTDDGFTAGAGGAADAPSLTTASGTTASSKAPSTRNLGDCTICGTASEHCGAPADHRPKAMEINSLLT